MRRNGPRRLPPTAPTDPRDVAEWVGYPQSTPEPPGSRTGPPERVRVARRDAARAMAHLGGSVRHPATASSLRRTRRRGGGSTSRATCWLLSRIGPIAEPAMIERNVWLITGAGRGLGTYIAKAAYPFVRRCPIGLRPTGRLEPVLGSHSLSRSTSSLPILGLVGTRELT